MATAISPTPAGSVHAPTTDTNRASSITLQPPSESPTLLAPAPTLTAPSVNGTANGVANPTTAPTEGGTVSDMRVYPRDGRVRNPVPSKLKNVKESMKGNFSVMHMDVASHRASEGRDAAAKRTSESTLLQAQMAQTDQYVSHQRRANYPRPPGLKQFNPDTSPKKPKAVKPPAVEPQAAPVVARALTTVETKGEQARLLTLLRSLPHHTVVDQICKGLAFFGGIPDAPPPADGKFPESAEANGSGSLFVGWIAEIFPDMERPRRTMPAPAAQASAPLRRPRGRPKGSKASKSRSDKGLKKGSQKSGKGTDAPGQDPQDESWVDVEMDDTMLELNETGDFVPRNAPSTPLAAPSGGGLVNVTPATGSTGGFRSINDTGSAPGTNSKRRGRPKGSKNRPKEKSVSQSGPPPKVTPVPVPVPMLDSQTQSKPSTAAQPKSNKSRPKPVAEPVSETTISSHQQPVNSGVPPPIQSHQATTATQNFTGVPDLQSLNSLAAYNQEAQLSVQPMPPATQSPVSQVKASTVTAKKRKRPGATAAARAEANAPGNAIAPLVAQQDISNGLMPSPQIQSQTAQPLQQPTPTQISAPPPAKRSRKSQDLSSSIVARRQTPNNANQKAAAPPLPVVPEPVDNQPDSGNTMSLNHPVAEGLEAHYAAMQSHTDSYNSRAQPKQHSISTAAMRSTASPVPVTAPAPAEGLDAHYEHFTSLQQPLPDNSRQNSTNRQQQHQQQQQRTAQTASPIPTQPSKPPQMASALSSQQQSSSSQGYYAQNRSLGASYNPQQQTSYANSSRGMANNSPNTGLVQHVTNSPQFSNQSNSPLMQTDNGYRSSPSLIHNSAPFANRRTTSASPLDNGAYRSTNNTGHGVPNHSPHFSTRQTSTTTASHNTTSHPALSPATFPNFPDSTFMDMGLDSSGGHGGLSMGGTSYGLNSNSVQQQQRTSTSSTAPLYSSGGMNNNYMGNSTMGRPSQNRWN